MKWNKTAQSGEVTEWWAGEDTGNVIMLRVSMGRSLIKGLDYTGSYRTILVFTSCS